MGRGLDRQSLTTNAGFARNPIKECIASFLKQKKLTMKDMKNMKFKAEDYLPFLFPSCPFTCPMK